ncbi:sodium:solute symporter family protein [Thermanaerovibrio acidaminovorans]|uniref:Na+/solute symporter n=1 Tax=Thermanaerovibrio acidaminovorans (strain ATCC 49978 / DSM 6589 / Su883) TaxID=525903 RepID=D1B9H1_THEAS|nr:sodium:solute symporter family protein [Thermanaerovibrio acidaminovorans]ACZ18924.1 Na+/solute symporter [Thermanaerovibrio acidaminovorans DSM 6589]
MTLFLFGVLLVLVSFALIGKLSSRGVKRAEEFTVAGRKASAWSVVGILLGALVGGASTVGTAQMAYMWGISAIWFTLGAGIGCLLLAVTLAKPLRRGGKETIIQIIQGAFGRRVAFTVLISSVVGTFLSVVSQFLSGAALVATVVNLRPQVSLGIMALLVLAFIASGGIKSYGALGKAKLVLLYILMGLCAIKAVSTGETPVKIFGTLPSTPYFNPFGRGIAKDLGSLVALIVGVFSTQIYVQSILAARDEATARRGALLSAFLMPPLGLMGIWVGLSLRSAGVEIEPSQALPWFVVHHFSPLVGGILWSALLITTVGCAAGLVLGIGTNVARDFISPLIRRAMTSRGMNPSGWEVTVLRGSILSVVLLALGVALDSRDGTILNWGYLSMGLRGSGTFFPLIGAVLFPRRLSPRWALVSSSGGLLGTLFWGMMDMKGEPLYAGLALSMAGLMLGLASSRGSQRL